MIEFSSVRYTRAPSISTALLSRLTAIAALQLDAVAPPRDRDAIHTVTFRCFDFR